MWGALILLAYYLVVCAIIPTILKVYTSVHDEVVRKSQHIAYSMSVFLLINLFDSWYAAIAAAFLLVIVGYPFLFFAERFRRYREFLVDRDNRGGELRKQLLYVQLSFAMLIFLFWGIFGINWRFLVVVAVMAWGFGDAAAALVGRFFGRKNFTHRFIEGSKTWEGTGAMAAVAAVALFLSLHFYAGQSFWISLLISLLVAPVCALVELFSWRGLDTLTVPLTTALTILPLVQLLGYLGLS
jgi:dolichol kinase